ncbi:MAG: hypothetical protein K0Q49_1179 [Haloplasmataceae bacterium]|jgi:hypothetical protein|nr:hypothetical protein [Haloplasmataceae bacterium]
MNKSGSKTFLFMFFLLNLTLLLSACNKVTSTENNTTGETTARTTVGPIQETTHLTYEDIVKRLYDLESLSIKPIIGEKSSQFSSYDRRSKYTTMFDEYSDWSVNGDWGGFIRKQPDGGLVIAEAKGPGYITRIWSAAPKTGHIKIYIDGASVPVFDDQFKNLFSLSTNLGVFNYSELNYVASQGNNFYIPITYNESIKVVLYNDWGSYYLLDYTTLPEQYSVESFKLPLSTTQIAALSKAQEFFINDLGTNPIQRTNETKITNSYNIEASQREEIFNSNETNAITGIRIKVNNLTEPFEDWEALRELTISAYWDGEEKPSVWAPLGDFFGSAAGINTFKALPVGMQEDGWFYSYWYMPFETGAKIVIGNDGTKTRNLDVEITTAPLDQPINELMRFHAKWTRNTDQEAGNDRWPDSLILKTEGQGRFLGFMLHLYKTDNRVDPNGGEGAYWWGEGDEKFFIDGEKFPSWFGTGTEDYFGYAWCDPSLFSRPFHSQPYNKGGVHAEGNRVNNRFQIIDNIPFQDSFEGYLEKYYSDEFVKRATVSYWYLDKNGTDDYEVKSLEERTNYYEYRPEVIALNEGESIYIESVGAGIVETQDMTTFGTKWSNNLHLWWRGATVGDELKLYINVETTQTFTLKANLTTAGDYGNVQFYANNNVLGNVIDTYSSGVSATGEITLGQAELQAGLNVITVKIVGKNSQSTNYMFGLDYLKVE